MKTNPPVLIFLLGSLIIFSDVSFIRAQIKITPATSLTQVVSELIGPGNTVQNAKLTCPQAAYGSFNNGASTNLGIDRGVVLTTGKAVDINGPASTSIGYCPYPLVSGDPLLDPIASSSTFDACKVEFDIIPGCDNLQMKYSFGSEEYPEYVNSGYNDAFGFFISGPNPAGGQYVNRNIATVPNTAIPVTINNINDQTNSSYYINNGTGTSITYDGFTKPLTAQVKVIPCKTYHMVLVIADGGDCTLDSGVFLEYQGITCFPSITASPDVTICRGSSTTLFVTGEGPDYTWSPSNGLNSTKGSSVVASPTATTTYYVTSLNCTGARDSVIVTVKELSVGSGPDVTICPGEKTTISAYGGSSYVWSPASGLNDPFISNPVASPTTTTTYIVSVMNNGCIGKDTVIVNVNSSIKVQFSANDVCVNNSTVFKDLSTCSSGSIQSWSWDFGDGSSKETVRNPQHVFTKAGNYNVKLIVSSDKNCKDSVISAVNVFPRSAPDFSSTTVCLGNSTTFSNKSQITSPGIISGWKWDFGEPFSLSNTALTQNSSHIYASAGTFKVKLVTTTNNGCKDSISYDVIVNANPIADFTFSSVCQGNNTGFTNLSLGSDTWKWEFGDPANNTSTIENPSFLYSLAGNYQVKLTTTNMNNCSASVSKMVPVYSLPVAAFGSSDNCIQSATSFTDKSTSQENIVSWKWSWGDGSSTVNQKSPSHMYNSPGNYNVTLNVSTSHGCADSITHVVVVYPRPHADFESTTVCVNSVTMFSDKTTITPSGSISTWKWDFGESGSTTNLSVLQNPNHTYSRSGTFNVKLVSISDKGCKDSILKSVKVNPLPKADFSYTLTCLGKTSSFNDLSSGATSWKWYFGDLQNSTSTATNPSFKYTTAGDFPVKLEVSDPNNCQASITKTVKVNAPPKADFSTSNVCLKSPSGFADLSKSSSGTITSWKWTFGDGSTLSGQKEPQHVYSSSGTFTVKLLISDNAGCTDSTSKSIVIYPVPLVDFSTMEKSGCVPSCFNFRNLTNSKMNSWEWNFGDGTISASEEKQHCYTKPGNYDISLKATSGNGCKDSVVKQSYINIYSQPKAAFSFTQAEEDLKTSIRFLNNSNGAIKWQWDFGDYEELDYRKTPVHSYYNLSDSIASYNVKLRVYNEYGCSDSITHTVYINPSFTFYVPNAFTPTADINNTFFGTGTGIKEKEMWIFNRWGNEIVHIKGSEGAWDGKKGNDSPSDYMQEDVYVWLIKVTTLSGKSYKYTGTVTLLK